MGVVEYFTPDFVGGNATTAAITSATTTEFSAAVAVSTETTGLGRRRKLRYFRR
jgi:hypothetical protein